MSNWHKVSDEKPPLNHYVLCFCVHKRYIIAKRIAKKDTELYHNGTYAIKTDDVKAWMEIEPYDEDGTYTVTD